MKLKKDGTPRKKVQRAEFRTIPGSAELKRIAKVAVEGETEYAEYERDIADYMALRSCTREVAEMKFRKPSANANVETLIRSLRLTLKHWDEVRGDVTFLAQLALKLAEKIPAEDKKVQTRSGSLA